MYQRKLISCFWNSQQQFPNCHINSDIKDIITCGAKLLESDWLGAMQLIRNCMGEMRAKKLYLLSDWLFLSCKNM